jgi:hypothetical protein
MDIHANVQSFLNDMNAIYYEGREKLVLHEGPKYFTFQNKHKNVVVRIDKQTGDIYAPGGKTIRGNVGMPKSQRDTIFHETGIIVNAYKLECRKKELGLV